MAVYPKRISITKGVKYKTLREASRLASQHKKGELLTLRFTESNPSWVLLYNHARHGQIDPRDMRNMKKRDLYFLAGMGYPHPDLIDGGPKGREQLTKLQGNVERAKIELNRRDFFWRSLFVVSAAFGGAILSGAIALYIKML